MAARLIGTFGKAVRSVKRQYGFGRYSMRSPKRKMIKPPRARPTVHGMGRDQKYYTTRRDVQRRHTASRGTSFSIGVGGVAIYEAGRRYWAPKKRSRRKV